MYIASGFKTFTYFTIKRFFVKHENFLRKNFTEQLYYMHTCTTVFKQKTGTKLWYKSFLNLFAATVCEYLSATYASLHFYDFLVTHK